MLPYVVASADRRRRRPLQSGECAADHIHGGHPGRARWGRALRHREHRYDGRGYRQRALACAPVSGRFSSTVVRPADSPEPTTGTVRGGSTAGSALLNRAYRAWGGKPPVGAPPPVRRVATDSAQVESGPHGRGMQSADLHVDNHWDWENGYYISTAVNGTWEGLEEPFVSS